MTLLGLFAALALVLALAGLYGVITQSVPAYTPDGTPEGADPTTGLASPPITTTASESMYAPATVAPDSARGTRPQMVVMAVMSTGRNRWPQPVSSASTRGVPSARSRFTWSTMTMPLLTTMPIRMISPVKATMSSS